MLYFSSEVKMKDPKKWRPKKKWGS